MLIALRASHLWLTKVACLQFSVLERQGKHVFPVVADLQLAGCNERCKCLEERRGPIRLAIPRCFVSDVANRGQAGLVALHIPALPFEAAEKSEADSRASASRNSCGLAYSAVGDILDRVWGAAADAVLVVKVGRQGDETVVDRRAIAWSKVTASSIVLVREAASGRRYQLRTVKVMLGTCNDETCKVIPIGGKVGPGAEVYLLHERQDMFVQQLHDRLAELEQTLRSAPKLLEDVRHLLFLAGVLIDTQRCQGKEQAAPPASRASYPQS